MMKSSILYKKRKNDYEINLTYKCNWFCNYCAVDTHNKKNITKKIILNNLKRIQNNSLVSFSGGEVGLLPKEVILFIIKYLLKKNCYLSLNTNGLFIKKYPELLKFFKDEILYHCSPDLKTPIELPNLNIKNIIYLIVVDNENFKYLKTFLFKYPNIKFEIIPASWTQWNTNPKNILNKNKIKFLRLYKNRITKRSYQDLLDPNKRYNDIIYLDEFFYKKTEIKTRKRNEQFLRTSGIQKYN